MAAICIQAHYRGYLARKLFVQLLYDKYMKVGVLRINYSLLQAFHLHV